MQSAQAVLPLFLKRFLLQLQCLQLLRQILQGGQGVLWQESNPSCSVRKILRTSGLKQSALSKPRLQAECRALSKTEAVQGGREQAFRKTMLCRTRQKRKPKRNPLRIQHPF